jgi:hypothetical protein
MIIQTDRIAIRITESVLRSVQVGQAEEPVVEGVVEFMVLGESDGGQRAMGGDDNVKADIGFAAARDNLPAATDLAEGQAGDGEPRAFFKAVGGEAKARREGVQREENRGKSDERDDQRGSCGWFLEAELNAAYNARREDEAGGEKRQRRGANGVLDAVDGGQWRSVVHSGLFRGRS